MTTIQKTFLTILILILGITIYQLYTHKTFNSVCGLSVTSHSTNGKVALAKPITINGNINNVSKECAWQMFEGQAGTVEAFAFVNNQWKSISNQTPVPVQNWMTSSTTFTVEIRVDTENMNIVDGTPIKVVFTEENASGELPVDTYTLNLVSVSGELDNVPESMTLSVYTQDKNKLASSCGITKKETFQIPKTLAVADASLRFLFTEELSMYGVYQSVTIEDKIAKIQLASDTIPTGRPYSSLSSCEVEHLTSVLKETLTQYDSITSVELYSPEGKIDF